MGTNMNFGSNPPPSADSGEIKPPANNPLTRQSSIYSLTFDEFQSTMGGMGKDFGSMNMDELLRNIWSAEETQTMASSCGALEGNGALQRQGSLTLPRTLSQKTVDQVWKDISREYSFGKDGIGTGGTNGNNMPQRQQTLGEMTLEEFLVRAGVVREDTQLDGKVNNGGFFGGNNTGFEFGFQQGGKGPNLIGNRIPEGGNHIGIQASNLHSNVNGVRSNSHQLAQQQQQQHQQPIFPKQTGVGYGAQMHLQSGGQLGSPGIRGGIHGIVDQGISNGLIQAAGMQGGGMGMVGLAGPLAVATRSPANQLSSDGIGKSSGDTSSVSPAPYVFNGSLRGRKYSAVEKVVERRQKRMIKNRESAARSRARKQAYTMELEAEVAKLKEENEELRKKHAELIEMQKKEVIETMDVPQGAKKRCLRRTQTGPW
ncbi:ABSCISIC ACID RESPONSIVE ELEMENTS-BINDING PROTEIN 2 [Hibiscus trionum]|uniref:ABSCISIC ACID RESPONSIVE ELEMENTS-BINDING PROTEIN 2 n=1 Tax=Hibiscus trionum TaxID=183268 RepID=A0A9W7I984_HIBTR|nr:ABSCISIC ACID RESPONSIVE ELEMENTS-BINDING PROTEIN 2 [Hibiscus trionum]